MDTKTTQKPLRRTVLHTTLIPRQGGLCYYCNCQLDTENGSPRQATVEHLVDKWSSHRHIKDDSLSNLVAACFQCNNTLGCRRNKIARDYYSQIASSRGIKLKAASTSSKDLYKMFGPVPQLLFGSVL